MTNVAWPRDDITATQAAAATRAERDAAASDAEAAADFYGRHADNGHAPEWDGQGGADCGTCGETHPAPEREAEPG